MPAVQPSPDPGVIPGDSFSWLVIPFGQNMLIKHCGHRRVPLDRPFSSIQPIAC